MKFHTCTRSEGHDWRTIACTTSKCSLFAHMQLHIETRCDILSCLYLPFLSRNFFLEHISKALSVCNRSDQIKEPANAN
uniref:Uncharacterized protein n=1 Tax=Physcomitrium patens TaxID=3218 RepID=A0A2K1KV82_PHYPA|nr:hypothetical protein PHYPA_004683 [Physcomitrium patens]